jgi:hypothetical protein
MRRCGSWPSKQASGQWSETRFSPRAGARERALLLVLVPRQLRRLSRGIGEYGSLGSRGASPAFVLARAFAATAFAWLPTSYTGGVSAERLPAASSGRHGCDERRGAARRDLRGSDGRGPTLCQPDDLAASKRSPLMRIATIRRLWLMLCTPAGV